MLSVLNILFRLVIIIGWSKTVEVNVPYVKVSLRFVTFGNECLYDCFHDQIDSIQHVPSE